MEEIIYKMLEEIMEEDAWRNRYMQEACDLECSPVAPDPDVLRHAEIMYHRACAEVIACKKMFQIVTGVPYETAMERMGEGA